MFKVPRTISLSWHLIVKIPLDVQLLVLRLDEVEAAGQVHELLPTILQHLRTLDHDI